MEVHKLSPNLIADSPAPFIGEGLILQRPRWDVIPITQRKQQALQGQIFTSPYLASVRYAQILA